MFWFKKKKEKDRELTPIPEIPKTCSHIWKDFPPYITCNYESYYHNYERQDYGKLIINIIEPYVCCKCFKREDVNIYNLKFDYIKEKDAIKKFEQIKQENSFLVPRPQVEDEIADMQHRIDRDLLQTLALYRPSSLGSTLPNNLPILDRFLNKEKNNE